MIKQICSDAHSITFIVK